MLTHCAVHQAAPKAAGTEEEADVDLLTEKLKPRKGLPPLLTQLQHRPAEPLSWIGVGFGLTSQLHRFWNKIGFSSIYLRQTANDMTGEHTSIMLCPLQEVSKRPPSFTHSSLQDPHRIYVAYLTGRGACT